MKHILLVLAVGLVCVGQSHAASSPKLADSIKVIRAVGPEGLGNTKASEAWKQLAATEASALPTILGAMDGANDLALNWLRAAVDTITARELAAGRKLPVAALEKFVRKY